MVVDLAKQRCADLDRRLRQESSRNACVPPADNAICEPDDTPGVCDAKGKAWVDACTDAVKTKNRVIARLVKEYDQCRGT